MARVFRKLAQLLDVDVAAVEDGDALVWDDDAGLWVPGAGGGGGGSDDQTAAEVPFTPAGGIAATNVQNAIQELDTEKAAASHVHSGDDITSGTVADDRIASSIARDTEVSSAVSTHAGVTTSVHGITNTANLIVEGDSRLTDARTPTAHSHTVSDIDSTGEDAGKVIKSDGTGGATWEDDETGGGGGTSPDDENLILHMEVFA